MSVLVQLRALDETQVPGAVDLPQLRRPGAGPGDLHAVVLGDLSSSPTRCRLGTSTRPAAATADGLVSAAVTVTTALIRVVLGRREHRGAAAGGVADHAHPAQVAADPTAAELAVARPAAAPGTGPAPGPGGEEKRLRWVFGATTMIPHDAR